MKAILNDELFCKGCGVIHVNIYSNPPIYMSSFILKNVEVFVSKPVTTRLMFHKLICKKCDFEREF